MTAHAVNAAEGIDGWMTRGELECLAGWASGCRRIVEVGVYAGRSATAMALAMPEGGRLYAVDDFRGEVNRPNLTGPDLDAAFRANCQGLIACRRIVPLPVASVDAAGMLADLTAFDLVVIDASHDYASVVADLTAWLPLVRPGGRLCGHDADQPDVQRALDEVLGAGTWTRPVGALWSYEVT